MNDFTLDLEMLSMIGIAVMTLIGLGALTDATPTFRYRGGYIEISSIASCSSPLQRRTADMAPLEDELRDYRARIGQARTKQVRAQTEFEGAQSRADTARTDLKENHGVSTPEEARAKLVELNGKLQAKKAEVEQKLTEAGA